MKFNTALDAKKFCSDIGRIDLIETATEAFVPDEKMIELFLVRRTGLVRSLKDFNRSQDTAAAWRRGRNKFMRGIQKFQKSTIGKRFHRELGRFLATRITRDKVWISRKDQRDDDDRLSVNRDGDSARADRSDESKHELSIYESGAILKALSSTKTHAYIMLEYYMPVQEEVELWLFLEEFLPVITSVEDKILAESISGITPDEMEILLRISDPAWIVLRFVEAVGNLTADQVESLWGKEKGTDPATRNKGAVNGKFRDMWESAWSTAVKEMDQEENGFYCKVADRYVSLLTIDKEQVKIAASESQARKPRRLQPIESITPRSGHAG